jgi:Na+-transporting NADH:ubiquinone oxidoreductase subunit NqrD
MLVPNTVSLLLLIASMGFVLFTIAAVIRPHAFKTRSRTHALAVGLIPALALYMGSALMFFLGQQETAGPLTGVLAALGGAALITLVVAGVIRERRAYDKAAKPREPPRRH